MSQSLKKSKKRELFASAAARFDSFSFFLLPSTSQQTQMEVSAFGKPNHETFVAFATPTKFGSAFTRAHPRVHSSEIEGLRANEASRHSALHSCASRFTSVLLVVVLSFVLEWCAASRFGRHRRKGEGSAQST